MIFLVVVYDAGFRFPDGDVLFFIRQVFTVRRFMTVYGSRFVLTASGGSCGRLIILCTLWVGAGY